MIPLPPTPQPFAFSPASPGHVAWDANATGWSASQFMAPGFGGWNQQQQQQGQHLSRPGSAQNIQRPSSAAPDMQTYQQQQTMSSMPPPRQDANGALMPQWVPVQPSISASPGPMSPATRQNSMPMPTPNSHLMRRPTGGSAHFMQEGQAHRSSAPVGYQPPFSPQPQPQLQQQNQGMAPSVSTPDFSAGNGTTRSYLPPGPEARPIPPPSPVQEQESNTAPAQYHQQQRVAFPSAPDPLPVTSPSTAAGLATIEEDSESQAGTMRSIKPMGGSVTRAEVEQFEAIAANEENEEELRKALHQLGLEPDPDAFKAKETVTSSAIEEGKTLPKPPVPSDKVKSTLANRPRASDIFANAKVQQAQQALDGRQQVNRSVSAQELKADAPVAASQRSVSASNAAPAAKAAPRQRRLSSLSRADSEQGLFALEFRLSRPTTPIAPSSPSVGSPSKALPREGSLSPGKREMVLGNLAPVGEGERQRKESALRAAAREAAKREQEAREASQREKEIREAAEKENLARAAVREREERERKEEAHRAQERERAHRQRENHDRERVLTDLAAERERDRERQERRRKREERERQEAKEREARALAVAPKKAETSAPEATRAEEKNGRTDTLQNGAANAQSKASASSENLVPAAVQLSSGASAGDRSAHGGSNKSGGERKVVNPEEVRELNRQAVGRVAGWLSASSSPASSELESAPREEKVKSPPAKSISPPKPSEISSSISTSKATPPSALARNHTDRSTSMPFPSLSSTAAPVARLPKSMSASSGLASTPSRRRAVTADTDEPLPMLSPELRALVDGSTVRARAPGTALRDHPTSRRISASSSTMSVVKLGEAKDAASPASQTGNSKETATAKTGSVATPPLSSSSSVRVRERHISMPARSSDIGKPLGPAQPTASLASLDRDGAAAAVREAKADDHQDETVVPASVKKTLLASTTAAAAPASENISASASQGGLLVSDKKAYDARSARGGRGGRVTSVAQLWTTIADPQKDAAGAQKEAANTPLATVKPKPRTSGLGGAPALDFSKAPSAPALSASASTSAAAYAPPRKVTSPLLKSAAVPFLNTTMPRPSFSVASPTSPVKVAAPLAPTLALTSTSIEAKDKVAPSPATAAAVRAARRQTADFLTRPTENLSTPAAAAVSKGTNTAIGSDRLRELRAKWGG